MTTNCTHRQGASGEIGSAVPVCDKALVEAALARVRRGLQACGGGSHLGKDIHEVQACTRMAEVVERWICRGSGFEDLAAQASIESLHNLQCSAAVVVNAS